MARATPTKRAVPAAKTAPGRQPAAKRDPAPHKKSAPAKETARSKKASPAASSGKTSPAAAKPAARKAAAAKKLEPAKTPAKKTTATTKAPAKVAASSTKAAPAKKPAPKKAAVTKTPRKVQFDPKFLDEQRRLLVDERLSLLGSAERLEGEAASLMEDLDPGDVQFDDESGEGDTLVVERERDLALSAQARQMIADIDNALRRLENGTYGLSIVSGRPIPKERLRAIPWATELVEEKVGGLGRR